MRGVLMSEEHRQRTRRRFTEAFKRDPVELVDTTWPADRRGRPLGSSTPACFRRWTRLAGPAAPERQQRRSLRGAGQDLVGTWRPLLPVARPAGPAGLDRAVLPWRVTLAHRAPFAGIATD